jgi:hypothetical protein
MDNRVDGKFCSFCLRAGSEDVRLIGGHGAWICQHCTGRFDAAFDRPGGSDASVTEPDGRSMTDEAALASLPDIVATGAQLDAFLHDWVGLLRERGISWHQIGLALGVSRQAVWQRFTRPRARAKGSAVNGS